MTAVPIDLSRDLEAVFDNATDLITTSALLDLVSQDWLNRLAVEAAARRLPVYAALSYDGRVELAPAELLDRRIVDAVNRHQRTDKGFGPALGPSAAKTAIAAFERVGYAVTHGLADWDFGPADRAIQTEILSGWAAAAREIGDSPQSEIFDWLEPTARADRRRTFVAPRRSRRSARAPHRYALSRQIAVEQHLVVETVHLHRHAQRLIGTLDRRQRETHASGAEHDRGHDHMQPVEAAGREKPRNGVCAAFDQDPAQATLGQGGEDRRRCDLPAGFRQPDNLDVLRQRRTHTAAASQDPAHAVVGEEPGARRQASAGVDHHANRLRA